MVSPVVTLLFLFSPLRISFLVEIGGGKVKFRGLRGQFLMSQLFLFDMVFDKVGISRHGSLSTTSLTPRNRLSVQFGVRFHYQPLGSQRNSSEVGLGG